jgi:hypothetical protein
MQFLRMTLCLTAVSLAGLATTATHGDEVGLQNTRFIWIGDGGTGSESFIGYYIHREFQAATLMQFDLSSHIGQTATSDATFTLPVDSFFSHWSTATNHTDMRLWQLSANNADVDLDDADRTFRDVSASLPWLTDAGATLGDWNTDPGAGGASGNFFDVLDGTTPIASTTGVNAGENLVWTVPQATLQSWLDGTAPPIVVFGNDQWSSSTINGQWGFNQSGATLSFTAIPEPGSLSIGLMSLGILATRRRKRR